MEKMKKFVQKKSNTFNCGVRLYCRTYSSNFLQAATDRKIKFKLHQLPPRYRQQMQTQKQLLCLQQRKPLKVLPIPLNQTKMKKDRKKIPKIKRTVRIIRRTVTVQPLKKVKNPSRVQATVLRIRKSRLLHQTVLQTEQKNDVQPTTQDKYKTDPVPSGKPKPVEPEEQETKDTNLYCTFTITCSTILDNIDDLDPEKS